MEYANTVKDQPYVIGTVQELPGVGWALLHEPKKTAVHENTPAAVDAGTLTYMRAEGVLRYVVWIKDTVRWYVVPLEILEEAATDPALRRKGVTGPQSVLRDRIYLPWGQWIVMACPAGRRATTVADIPYADETRILEDGSVKWRGQAGA
jgi:hypothetical protein